MNKKINLKIGSPNLTPCLGGFCSTTAAIQKEIIDILSLGNKVFMYTKEGGYRILEKEVGMQAAESSPMKWGLGVSSPEFFQHWNPAF